MCAVIVYFRYVLCRTVGDMLGGYLLIVALHCMLGGLNLFTVIEFIEVQSRLCILVVESINALTRSKVNLEIRAHEVSGLVMPCGTQWHEEFLELSFVDVN